MYKEIKHFTDNQARFYSLKRRKTHQNYKKVTVLWGNLDNQLSGYNKTYFLVRFYTFKGRKISQNPKNVVLSGNLDNRVSCYHQNNSNPL